MTILRRLFILTLAIAASVTAYSSADEDSANNNVAKAETRTYYIELQGRANRQSTQRAIRMDVNVEFGQEITACTGMNAVKLAKIIRFGNMIDALNFFADFGWKLESAYSASAGQSAAVHHWILSKEVEHPDQLFEGLSND